MPLTRKFIPSPNFSARETDDVRLIVLHTAEGARTIESLGDYFSKPGIDVSSHAGADNKANTIGEYVKPHHKAWTQANANPISVSLELCGFAAWPEDEWYKHPRMLENCARWIAEEAARFRIPIVRLSPSAAKGSGRGVVQHVDLGSWGGGHHDCGSGFPMQHVLEMAREVDQPVADTTWYFIQDIGAVHEANGQRMYYGGWDSQAARDTVLQGLVERYGHPFRAFHDARYPAPYFIDNSAYVTEIYGGWADEGGRNRMRKLLEEKFNRTLRPFSETRPHALGGSSWGCKNLVKP